MKYSRLSQTTLSLALLSVLGSHAHAAVGTSVQWADSRTTRLKIRDTSPQITEFASAGNLRDAPTLEDRVLRTLLDDPESRISNQFSVPPELRARTLFWLRVYTVWSSQQVALFDEQHPELVYEVLDFRPLADRSRNAAAYEIERERKITRALTRYRAALRRLSSGKVKPISPEERRVAELLRTLPHRHLHSELARSLRAQTGQRDQVIRALIASRPYWRGMEVAFEARGIPREITRLSLVESSFNLEAVSKTGAAGVWQFMPASAREYMKVRPDLGIDERLSPFKSTIAAARLLDRSYRSFRSWPLAITTYHHGTTAIKHRRGKDNSRFQNFAYLFEGCNKRKRGGLGYASQNYYSEFLAMLTADAYRDRFYGHPPQDEDHAVFWVSAPSRTSLADAALRFGVPLFQFRELNPDVLDPKRPLPAGLKLAIPAQHSGSAILVRTDERNDSRRRKNQL